MKGKFLIIALLGAIVLSGCVIRQQHPTEAGPDGTATKLTVGKVQGEIKEGMPASDVAAIMGSPNIVTTDEKRREVWIYDKVSSNRVDTINSSRGSLIFWGASSAQGESTTTQKTLTVIIKFDDFKKVRDFAYNYTQF